jgi:hypothetical protein
VSGFSHLLLHCPRNRSKGTISLLFSCINGPAAHGGRVAFTHLHDMLAKGGDSKSPFLDTGEMGPY